MVGTPAVVESNGDTDIFLRDTSSLLVHVHRAHGGAFKSEAWKGVLASDPAAAVSGDVVSVVAVGAGSNLAYWSKTRDQPATAMEVVAPDTQVVGPPVLLGSQDGSLDALVRRIDGGVQHVYRRGGGWSSEALGSNKIRGFPAGVLTPDNNLHAYARGLDDTLLEVVLPVAGGGRGPSLAAKPVGTPPVKIAGSPSAIVDPATNEVRVVARLPSGDLELYTFKARSGWTERSIPRPAGPPPSQGTASFTLSPVIVPEGVFVRAEEGSVWFYSFETASWTWQSGLVR
jgi:hypothetical protein